MLHPDTADKPAIRLGEQVNVALEVADSDIAGDGGGRRLKIRR